MTKRELIDLTIVNLGKRGDHHPRQIELNMAGAYIQILFAAYSKVPSFLDRISKTYLCDVSRDEDSGIYYTDLPVEPIRFTDIGEGIRRVWKVKQKSDGGLAEGDEILFIPISPNDTQIISSLQAGVITSEIGYYQRDTRLYFYKMKSEIEQVNVDVVRRFEDISDDEQVLLPAGGDQMFAGVVLEIMKGIPYVDPRLRKINVKEV